MVASSVIDTLERQSAQLEFLRGATIRIQEADTADAALQAMIERVCAFRQWPVGHAYMVAPEGHLERPPLWYLHDAERFTLFRKSIEELPIADGIGLAERVLDLGDAQWTRSVWENRHESIARAARETGITTAFAFPVSVNMTIKAVVEFFSVSEEAPEQSFLELMATLCIQLGRSFERRETAELEAANQRLKLANARLRQALAVGGDTAFTGGREQSRFLTNMGHEFRTPLTTILGFSELLLAEAEASGDEGRLEDLGRIHDAASSLLELVNGVIDLSQVETRTLEINVDSREVRALVTELCESLHRNFREKGNILEIHCGHDAGVLRTDCQKVRQCLKQLLENANKFTENGVVELTVSRIYGMEGDRIVFRVRDTGIGMTAEQLGRLFRPFSQADTSAARRYGGVGLGLALAQNLAGLLGGNIRVESVLGEGTICFFELPAALPLDDENGGDRPAAATTP